MIILKSELDKSQYDNLSSVKAKIYICLVEINASDSIASIVQEINDKSWIAKLNIVEQISYEARLKGTVKKIMDECNIFDNETKHNIYDYSIVGEYIISKEGRTALTAEYNHSAIPVAELWKEKTSRNPGFDYHSESTSNLIVFGEAKYNAHKNPYNDAIEQIENFIIAQKDCMELSDLQHFVSSKAVKNFEQSKKGFSIAFSLKKTNNPLLIVENVISSDKIANIYNYDEFYIIGVVINDK